MHEAWQSCCIIYCIWNSVEGVANKNPEKLEGKRTWEGIETRNANTWLESHTAKVDWGREASFQLYSFLHLNRQNHSAESICISGTFIMGNGSKVDREDDIRCWEKYNCSLNNKNKCELRELLEGGVLDPSIYKVSLWNLYMYVITQQNPPLKYNREEKTLCLIKKQFIRKLPFLQYV